MKRRGREGGEGQREERRRYRLAHYSPPSRPGYIKNDPTSRTFTFLAMFSLTLSHVLMKTIVTALLLSVRGRWLAMYVVGDMLLYMLLKVMRGDFRYWINLPDPLHLVGSFLARLCVKLLVDFTLCLHDRHRCVK